MYKVKITDELYVMDGQALKELQQAHELPYSDWVESAMFIVQVYEDPEIRPVFTGLYMDDDKVSLDTLTSLIESMEVLCSLVQEGKV